MSAARLSKADTARELLQGLGNHTRPTAGEPGDEWVGLAAAANSCAVKPRVVADAARRGAIKVRWFQRTEAAIPVPMLSSDGVERLAAELRRERELAEQTKRERRQRREQARRLAERREHELAATPAQPRSWYLAYQERIRQGLEECRCCGATEGLRVCRVRRGEGWALHRCTILCSEHADDYPPGDGQFHWRIGMDTLADEEKAAPPERKWALAALDEARRKARESAAGG